MRTWVDEEKEGKKQTQGYISASEPPSTSGQRFSAIPQWLTAWFSFLAVSFLPVRHHLDFID